MKNTTVRNFLIILYVLIILGFSATSKAEGFLNTAALLKNAATTVQGSVTQTIDGHFYLIVDESHFFELKSDFNLEPFNGWFSSVSGYETSLHKVGPVFSTASMDPLSESEGKSVAAPVLLVLSINGISLLE
jgi:hypothetical protein